MDPAQWCLLIATLLSVALSSFFSASETAFAAASRVKLKAMHQHGTKGAEDALRLLDAYDQMLTTVLVGNNVVNIAGTAVSTVLFTALLGSMGATVSTVVMTVLILIFGEVTPKTLAKRAPERFAIRVAPVMLVLRQILYPVNWLFGRWKKVLEKLFPLQEDELPIEDELKTIVSEAQVEGDMDRHESELIRSAIEFQDQDALDIMTPRVDVEALEDTATMEEAAEMFRNSGYSRIPVYHEDMDHVVGILHEKSFYIAQHAGARSIHSIMAPPVYAPASIKVSKLLKLFQASRTHMVIVLDEFGGTEGVVTLEDVLEELVGEIWDEHDDVSRDLVQLEDGSYLVSGLVPIQEMTETLGIEDIYEADTVGGFAAEVLGRIPEVGDVFQTQGMTCRVTGMEKRRVTQVRISREKHAEHQED